MRTAQRIARVRLESVSPDQSVRVRLSVAQGIRVAIDGSGFRAHHTEAALAAQVRHALERAMRGYRRAMASMVDGRDSPRRGAFDEALAETQVVGVSSGGNVKVKRRGESGFDVKIRPGVMDHLKPSDVVDEVNQAVGEAQRLFGLRIVEIHQAVYQGEYSKVGTR